MRALAALINYSRQYTFDIECMKSYLAEGMPDDVWVPQIAREGRFVITGDRAKKAGAPLDILLPCYGVSGAFFTGSLQNAHQLERMRAIVSVLPELAQAVLGPPGERYKIGIRHSKYHSTFFKLWHWPLNDGAKRRREELAQSIPKSLWGDVAENDDG